MNCDKKDNCCKSFIEKRVAYICRNKYRYFMKKANVVGLGLGYKVINHIYTNKKCITIYVSEKISPSKLCYKDKIPTIYEGILTDVVQTGVPTLCAFNARIRPVIGGYSVGSVANPNAIGSAGCLVTDGSTNYMLGTNHLLAGENKIQLGTQVLQPALKDGGSIQTDIIGSLYKYVPLDSSKVNCSDAAMVKLLDDSIAVPLIALAGKIKGCREAELGDNVQKVGRTSEQTFGLVTSVYTTIQIAYPKLGKCLFKDQVVTTKMSDDGDSGAMLLDGSNNVMGMLYSDTVSNTIYSPISSVLSALEVDLITS